MIKLIVDVGNTFTKIALFTGDELLHLSTVKKGIYVVLDRLLTEFEMPRSCIVSVVRDGLEDLESRLREMGIPKIVIIRSGLLLPVKVNYKTPGTLGGDRLANACGAAMLFPGTNTLVVDTGTCIKYDFVTSEGAYLGGSISPGLLMRYKALNRFTGKLPYFKPVDEFPTLTGQSTEGSIRSGVEIGILAEMEGIINRYERAFELLQVVITGGDHPRFADKLKSAIFVSPNLTINGLKVILDHNDH